MASRYAVGSTWNSAANWSATDGGAGGAGIPTASDDVFFTANSISMTVDVAGVGLSLNFTGFTNTITMSSGLTISGSVTLVSAMTIAGSGSLTMNESGTLTTNGKTWPNNFSLTSNDPGATTVTLADDFDLDGNFSTDGGTSGTLAGAFTMYLAGNLTMNKTLNTGAANIILNGTGIWSGASAVGNNLTINTAGTITISGTVAMGAKTLLYSAGTVVTTGSTLNCNTSGATLTTSGISWNNVNMAPGADPSTLTLGSTLDVNGNLTIAPNTVDLAIGGAFNITVAGNLSITTTGGRNVTGAASIVLDGTGTFTSSYSTGSLQKNVTFNTSGTITLSGTWRHSGSTITYTAGTISAGTSTLAIVGSTTLNTTGMSWNAVQMIGTITATLSSDMDANGLLTIGTSTTTTTVNGGTIYAGAGYTAGGTTGNNLGTSRIVMDGTGTIDMSAKTTGTNQLEILIDAPTKTITFSTITQTVRPIRYKRGILAGNVVGFPKTLGFSK